MWVVAKHKKLFITPGKKYKVLGETNIEYHIIDNISKCWHKKSNFYTQQEWRQIQLDKIL